MVMTSRSVFWRVSNGEHRWFSIKSCGHVCGGVFRYEFIDHGPDSGLMEYSSGSSHCCECGGVASHCDVHRQRMRRK